MIVEGENAMSRKSGKNPICSCFTHIELRKMFECSKGSLDITVHTNTSVVIGLEFCSTVECVSDEQ